MADTDTIDAPQRLDSVAQPQRLDSIAPPKRLDSMYSDPGKMPNFPAIVKNAQDFARQHSNGVLPPERAEVIRQQVLNSSAITPRQHEQQQAQQNANQGVIAGALTSASREAGKSVLRIAKGVGDVFHDNTPERQDAYEQGMNAVDTQMATKPTITNQAAGFVGGATPVALGAVAAGPAAPAVLGLAGGAESVAGTGTDIQQRRDAGYQVSTNQERAAKAASGAVGGAVGYAAGKAFGKAGELGTAAGRLAAQTVVGAGAGVVGKAGENVVAKETYDPNRPITQGVGEAAAGGAAGGILFGVGGEFLGVVGKTNPPRPDRPIEGFGDEPQGPPQQGKQTYDDDPMNAGRQRAKWQGPNGEQDPFSGQQGSQQNQGGRARPQPQSAAAQEASARAELGLPPDGPLTNEQVKAAFRARVRVTHPDSGGSAEAFYKTVDAHDFLNAKYPRQAGGQTPPPEASQAQASGGARPQPTPPPEGEKATTPESPADTKSEVAGNTTPSGSPQTDIIPQRLEDVQKSQRLEDVEPRWKEMFRKYQSKGNSVSETPAPTQGASDTQSTGQPRPANAEPQAPAASAAPQSSPPAVEAPLAKETTPTPTSGTDILPKGPSAESTTEKENSNAVQQPSPGKVFQRQPEQDGSQGSKRLGVEQGQQGQEAPKTLQKEEPRPEDRQGGKPDVVKKTLTPRQNRAVNNAKAKAQSPVSTESKPPQETGQRPTNELAGLSQEQLDQRQEEILQRIRDGEDPGKHVSDIISIEKEQDKRRVLRQVKEGNDPLTVHNLTSHLDDPEIGKAYFDAVDKETAARRDKMAPVESGQSDVQLWANKGKELTVKGIAKKMQDVAGAKQPRKTLVKVTKPPGIRTPPKDIPAGDVAGVAGAISTHAGGLDTRGKSTVDYSAVTVDNDGKRILSTDSKRALIVESKGNENYGKDGQYTAAGTKAKSTLKPYEPKETIQSIGHSAVIDPLLKNQGEPNVRTHASNTIRMLRQAETITDEEYKGVLAVRNPQGDIGFVARDGQGNHAAVNVRENATDLGAVNPRYLREAIESVKSLTGNEDVHIAWNTPDKPLVVSSEGSGRKVSALVMPIHAEGKSGVGAVKDEGTFTKTPLGAEVKPKGTIRKGAVSIPTLGDIFTTVKNVKNWIGDALDIEGAPKLTRAGLGPEVHAHAFAGGAAPYMARDMVARVFGENYKDQGVLQKTQKALNADNVLGIYDNHIAEANAMDARERAARALPAGTPGRDETIKVARRLARLARARASLVAKAQNLTDLQQTADDVKTDPKVMDAIDKWKTVVHPPSNEMYNELKGLNPGAVQPTRGRNFAARVNLLALDPKTGLPFHPLFSESDTPKASATLSGNPNNPRVRKDTYNRMATGTGAYSEDPEQVLTHMLANRWNEVTKLRLFKGLEREGIAVLPKRISGRQFASPPSQIGGEPVKPLDITIPRTTRKGGTEMEPRRLYVKASHYREVRDVLNTDLNQQSSAFLKAMTSLQMLSGVDVTAHSFNQLRLASNTLGEKSAWADLAKKAPGVGDAKGLYDIVRTNAEVHNDSPNVRADLAEMAKKGYIRPEFPATGIQAVTGIQKFVHNNDTAVRLIMLRHWRNLVARGDAPAAETEERKFVNQLGQYNSRLLNPIQRALKQMSISPFMVAGKSMNRMGRRYLTGDPGFSADGWARGLKLRLIQLGLPLGVVGGAALANYLKHGNVFGRKGTPIGAYDTGEDDENGNHKVIDLAQAAGLRRGMGQVGGTSLIEGLRQGKNANQIGGNMLEEGLQAYMHPYLGPGVSFAEKAFTGHQLDLRGKMDAARIPEGYMAQHAEYARAALQSQNPMLYETGKALYSLSSGGGLPEGSLGKTAGGAGLNAIAAAAGYKSIPGAADAAEEMAKAVANTGETFTQADKDKMVARRELLSSIRQSPQDTPKLLNEAQRKGVIESKQRGMYVEEGRRSELANRVNRMSIQDAIRVWKAPATEAEKQELLPILRDKMLRATPDDRKALIDAIR